MNPELLRQFLINANYNGYTTGDTKSWIKEADGSTTIPYEEGDFRSHDNFFGGEPYGGRWVVFYQGRPVWIMVYYGWIMPGVDANHIYSVLREALKHMPTEAPFRGPKEFRTGDHAYLNAWSGDIDKYSGEEQIFEGEKMVYQANYFGGFVNQ